MRGSAVAALAAVPLVLWVSACGDGEPDSAGLPSEPGVELDAAALPVYSLGEVGRIASFLCRDPGYDEFDFWVGTWDVLDPSGAKIATSVISSEVDDCMIMEDYIEEGGFQGKSINIYDRSTGTWHQTFVDNIIAGSFRLSGGLEDIEMVMRGSQPVFNFGTGTVRQRDVTAFWTPLSEGRVRQRFDVSFDGGPAATTFDGLYVPEPALDRATPAFFPFCENVIAEFRQLDFWLGEWSVSSKSGRSLGSSEVVSDLNGCLIQEDFETPIGYRSRSYLYYDFVAEKWFRTFGDNLGGHAELSGELVGDAMVMTGELTAVGGKPRRVRVTIAPDGAGVRQTWQVLNRAGKGPALALDYAR